MLEIDVHDLSVIGRDTDLEAISIVNCSLVYVRKENYPGMRYFL